MEFECAFCKKKFIYDEPVDINYELKYKYHVCPDCYLTLIMVVKEGQCDSAICRRASKIFFQDK